MFTKLLPFIQSYLNHLQEALASDSSSSCLSRTHRTKQIHFVVNKLPLATLGSLIERSRFDALCDLLNHVMESEDPKQRLEELTSLVNEIFKIRASRKHMNGLYPTLESSKLVA